MWLVGFVKRSNGLFLFLAGCEMRSGNVIAADRALVSARDEKKVTIGLYLRLAWV